MDVVRNLIVVTYRHFTLINSLLVDLTYTSRDNPTRLSCKPTQSEETIE